MQDLHGMLLATSSNVAGFPVNLNLPKGSCCGLQSFQTSCLFVTTAECGVASHPICPELLNVGTGLMVG